MSDAGVRGSYLERLPTGEAARQLSNLLKWTLSASFVLCIIEEINIEVRLFPRVPQGSRRRLSDGLLRKRTKPGTQQSHLGNHLMLNDEIEGLGDFLPPLLAVDLRPIGQMKPVYHLVN